MGVYEALFTFVEMIAKYLGGPDGPMHRSIRFSFGPLGPDSYDNDMEILAKCV